MEKERKIKVLSLVALIVAVLGLTVAFAALSQTLTINGTASVDAAEWDIHFENLIENSQSGGKLNATPIMDGTSITGIDATITKPGDYTGFFVDIINNGTIDAKVSSFELSKLCTLSSPVESCDWNNDGQVTQEDIDKVNDNIAFAVAYLYDNEINGEYSGNAFKVNDVLRAGEKRTITVFLGYEKLDLENGVEDEATELPKRDLQFNDLNVTINYAQTD